MTTTFDALKTVNFSQPKPSFNDFLYSNPKMEDPKQSADSTNIIAMGEQGQKAVLPVGIEITPNTQFLAMVDGQLLRFAIQAVTPNDKKYENI